MTAKNDETHQRTAALYQVIDEVADLVATFDDRLQLVPTSAAGQCILTFTSPQTKAVLMISAQLKANDSLLISLAATGSDAPQPVTTAYEGSYDLKAIRQRLSLALAEWYGQIVRYSAQSRR